MTHEDLLIRLISEHGKISIEEAKFVFGQFRSVFPGPDYLDRDLSDTEAETILNFYRNNQDLTAWISQILALYRQKPLPSV